jgi:hypothetical protein
LAHGAAVAEAGPRNSPSESAERPHKTRSNPEKVSAAQSPLGNAPPPRSALVFYDLRHQAITEMAEAGASDATLMAVAGHMSRRMLEHNSHVRMPAKRSALEKLESGLMGGPSATSQPESRNAN